MFWHQKVSHTMAVLELRRSAWETGFSTRNVWHTLSCTFNDVLARLGSAWLNLSLPFASTHVRYTEGHDAYVSSAVYPARMASMSTRTGCRSGQGSADVPDVPNHFRTRKFSGCSTSIFVPRKFSMKNHEKNNFSLWNCDFSWFLMILHWIVMI